MNRRWKLTLEYDGSGFAGWQKQPSGRTVQGELENALEQFCRQKIDVTGQGRTDRGVHAESQAAHADLPAQVEGERLLSAMRGLLPPDLAVIAAEPVPSSFHARFDARSRRYRYQVAARPTPIHRSRCWVFEEEMDEELLKRCAELLPGEHNFVNFARVDNRPDEEYRCTIRLAEWYRSDPFLCFRISGNRFLRHMVRRLVGTMVHVASGRFEPDQFAQLLEGARSGRKGYSAPAGGLFLETVEYGPIERESLP